MHECVTVPQLLTATHFLHQRPPIIRRPPNSHLIRLLSNWMEFLSISIQSGLLRAPRVDISFWYCNNCQIYDSGKRPLIGDWGHHTQYIVSNDRFLLAHRFIRYYLFLIGFSPTKESVDQRPAWHASCSLLHWVFSLCIVILLMGLCHAECKSAAWPKAT